MEFLSSPQFWIAVGQIILIDILLGGDNAVVIALACRKLPPKQRTQGILWGTAGAIVLRIVLIFFALTLLAIPFLKIVGALLLLWIGVKLLVPEHEDGHASIEGSDKLWGAVKTVIVADFVMSLDNVIAIAGAAEASGTGHGMALVVFGVLVSIPIIVWGSQLVIKLMDRYPIIITLGGMLLGWIAGTMMVTDPALVDPQTLPGMPKIEPNALVRYAAGAAGALLVLAIGKWIAMRRAAAAASKPAVAGAVQAQSGRLRRMLLGGGWLGRLDACHEAGHRHAPGSGRPGWSGPATAARAAPRQRRRVILHRQQDAGRVLPGAGRGRVGSGARCVGPGRRALRGAVQGGQSGRDHRPDGAGTRQRLDRHGYARPGHGRRDARLGGAGHRGESRVPVLLVK